MPHTARHKATHGRKGHSLKTVIKCDRQRALLPRFADTFLGAWPSPVQLQLSSQFSLRLSLRLSSQSNPVELSSVSFCSSIHISHKSRASPPRLCTCSTLHSLLALALTVSPPLPLRLCLHRDMRTSGVVVVVIIIDMAGGRFAQSLTWSPRPHIAYWISCLPLLRRRPGSGNILC